MKTFDKIKSKIISKQHDLDATQIYKDKEALFKEILFIINAALVKHDADVSKIKGMVSIDDDLKKAVIYERQEVILKLITPYIETLKSNFPLRK